MKQSKLLILTTVVCFLFVYGCKSKSECPAYDEPSSKNEKKEGSKYKLILLKDGKRIGKSSKKRNKKAQQKLFKKKVVP